MGPAVIILAIGTTVLLIVVAVTSVRPSRRTRSEHLQKQFRPEYDRVVTYRRRASIEHRVTGQRVGGSRPADEHPR